MEVKPIGHDKQIARDIVESELVSPSEDAILGAEAMQRLIDRIAVAIAEERSQAWQTAIRTLKESLSKMGF